jgi:hypothetical protein
MKLNLPACLLFFLLAANCLHAQVAFQKTFPGTMGISRNIQQTFDNGYIISGRTTAIGAGANDCYLIKTDSSGNQQWAKSYGAASNEYSYAVQQTADSGYVFVAWTNSFSGPDSAFNIYLVKTDNNGSVSWAKIIGDTDWDHALDICQAADGGYIICGYVGIVGHDYLYLVRTDSTGNILWSKEFIGDQEVGWSVRITSDGGFIIAGIILSGTEDIYLVKTDANGNIQWRRSIGGANWDRAFAVQQTSDGGYIVAGHTSSFGAGNTDVYVGKTDSSGALLWSKTYGGANDDYGYFIEQANDGGYIITGNTNSFDPVYNEVYLIRTDSIGDLVWSKTFGLPGNDNYGYCVQQVNDGGYIVSGISTAFNNNQIYIIKTDANGNSGCNEGNAATIVNSVSSTVTTSALTIPYSYGTATGNLPSVSTGNIASAICFGTPTGINEMESENSITVYPNPSRDNFTIQINSRYLKTDVVYLKIVDLTGRCVFKKQIQNTKHVIQNTDFSPGVYFVEVHDGENRIIQKLVIQ